MASKPFQFLILLALFMITIGGEKSFDAPIVKSETKLDALYENLRNAPNAIIAQQYESEIFLALNNSKSEVINLQMAVAMAAHEKNDNANALLAFDEILKRDTNFTEARNNKAAILYKIGERDAALANLERIIEIEPRHFAAWTAIGNLRFEKNDIDGARRAFQNALYHNPYNEAAKRGLFDIESKTNGIGM